MKESFSKKKISSKQFSKLFDTIVHYTKSSTSDSKFRIKNNNLQNSPKITFPHNAYNQMQRILNKTCTNTSKEKSTIISSLSTPKQITLLMKTQHNGSNRGKMIQNKSINKMKSECAQDITIFNLDLKNKALKIEVFYGECVFSCSFHQNTSIKQIHLYFFREIVKLQKKNHQRILGFIGFQALHFIPFIDYWINIQSQNVNIFLKNGIDSLRLKPLFSNIHTREVNIKDFIIYKCIGVGGFSKVFLGKCKTNGKLCALKFINKSYIIKNNKFKLLFNEKEILSMLDHKNLIQLYYSFQTKNYIVFALQYCPNNELYQYLMQKGSLTQKQVRPIFIEMLEGIDYLHQNKILYRDIKLQNILIDALGSIKITDFGLSKPHCEQKEITYSYCGSPEYMAPEMLMKCGHSFQVDFYALGIILYQLLIGKSPFSASTKQEIYYSTINVQVKFPKTPKLSNQVKSLIRGLLIKNPNHRIGSLNGIKQIINHPWLKNKKTIKQKTQFKGKIFRQYREIQNSETNLIQKEFLQENQIFEKEIKNIYFQNMKNYKARVNLYMQYEQQVQKIMAGQKQSQILRAKNLNEIFKKNTQKSSNSNKPFFKNI